MNKRANEATNQSEQGTKGPMNQFNEPKNQETNEPTVNRRTDEPRNQGTERILAVYILCC